MPGGFALVIALGLMAFVVLLLLAITTLVRVETQSTQIRTARMEAQQNALLGLQLALGELQMAAGPDSRVTVASEMFDQTPDTGAVDGVATRHYTGVFRAHETTQPLQAFRDSQNSPERALKWLASSENTLTDPVAAGPATYSPETISIGKVRQADSATMEDIQVGKISTAGGGYAWWVADEGMKARFNTVDPGIGRTEAEVPFNKDKLDVVQARQSNFRHVSDPPGGSGGFAPKFSDLLDGGALLKLNSPQSFHLLSSDWGDWMLPEDPGNPGISADVNPDVTLYSYGVPVDVTQGRLKEDLTVYLETGKGLEDDAHIVRGDSGDDPDYIGPSPGVTFGGLDDNLPRFGLLRDWNTIGKEIGEGAPIVSRPNTALEHGVHPILKRAGFSVSVAMDGPPREHPTDPELCLVDLVPMVYLRAELWNPYNVPLAPEKYLVEMTLPHRLLLQRYPFGDDLPPAIPREALPDFQVYEVVDYFAEGVIQRDSAYSFGDNRPWIRMIVDTGALLGSGSGMQPGETIVFSPEATFPLSQAIYSDQPASVYTTSSDINYAASADVERGSPSGFFVVGSSKTFTFPKPPGMDPIDPASPRPHYYYILRYQMTTNEHDGLEENLSYRFSRLNANGAPTLLTSKDPSKSMPDNSWVRRQHQQSGYDFSWRNARLFNSRNFDRIGRFDTGNFNNHRLTASQDDWWAAAARSGGSRSGGDRRNGTRNPRGGLLRDNLSIDGWQYAAHRTNSQNNSILERFWDDNRWTVEPGPWGNYGSVEGFIDGVAGNSEAFKTGTTYAFFDFPRRFGSIFSLGQLQHADLNPFAWGSSFQVGYSRAPHHLARDALVDTDAIQLPNERIDLPYLVNTGIWDRFYLSTIPQSGPLNTTMADPPVLPNNRHHIVPDLAGNFPPDANLRNSAGAFQQSAAHILVEGAFNVNSVSVNAWEALFLSMAGKSFPSLLDGPYNPDEAAEFSAFPRFPDPVFGVADNETFDSKDPLDRFQHGGVHVTSRSEIRQLAENVVAEVKRRGPFFSLADFINRRVVADSGDLDRDYEGLMGTLEAAIQRVSQTEDALNHNLIFGKRSMAFGPYLDPSDIPSDVSSPNSDFESLYGVPRGHKGTALEANPSFLMQGDILQSVGPFLSARSDTFLIRAYGESVDPLTGEANATSRCEAVVQRVAQPVAVGDDPVRPTGAFGRSFVIVAFRWLD